MNDDTKAWVKKLNKFNKDLLPKVVANTLNTVSELAQKQSINNVKGRFTLRNQFTLGSFMHWKASPKDRIYKINAVIGSRSPYLPIQEEGAHITPKKRVHAIATLWARGGANQNVIRKRYRLNELGEARLRKSIYFMLPSGIYYRKGRAKKRRQVGVRRELVKVYSFTRKTIKLRPKNWHTDAVKKWSTEAVMARAFRIEAQIALKDLY